MKYLRTLPSTEDLVRAEKAHRRFADFFRYGWHVKEKETPLEWNWHLDVLCDHIQATLEDWMAVKRWQQRQAKAKAKGKRFTQPQPEQRIQNLVINIPPGTSKSRIVSVYAMPWMWLHWPSWGALCLSVNPSVALRDALYCRDVLESDWYKQWFSPEWEMRYDRKAISNYGNSEGGSRLSFGFFANVVGDRRDAIILDDPNDPEDRSPQMQDRVNARWDNTLGNRVNDLRTSIRLGVQQRVGSKDWTGHILAQGVASSRRPWVHLCIPLEFEPQRLKENPNPAKFEYPIRTPIGWTDPRTERGEVLDPVRFTPQVIASEKQRLRSYGTAAQLQQRPAPTEGGIWKRFWWKFWVPEGVTLPPCTVPLADGQQHVCEVITLPKYFDWKAQSWDMAFGKSETSSMVVGQAWGLRGNNRFLFDQIRSQMEFSETSKAVKSFSAKHPDIEAKFIENKANGPAIMSSLRDVISGMIPIEPEGDKVARAMAEQGTLESGFVYLPHPQLPEAWYEDEKGQLRNWVEEFIDEAANFPNGAYNDVVDTASQVLRRFRLYLAVKAQEEDEPESRTGRR